MSNFSKQFLKEVEWAKQMDREREIWQTRKDEIWNMDENAKDAYLQMEDKIGIECAQKIRDFIDVYVLKQDF